MTYPVQKLLGITDTTITKIKNSKLTPGFIAKPLSSIQSYGHTVIEGRNDYQPKARSIIKQYGDKQIKSIVIVRQPIQSFINTAFNALTFGQFQKKLETLAYDKLFHLRMILTMEDGKQIQLEKNEVINMTTKIDKIKGQEEMPVSLIMPMTLNQLLEGGKKILGDRYFTYRAFGNNCQDYQIALLKGSNLLTPQLETFIKQDVEELANLNPYLKKIANTMTDLGGKFNEIIHGTGIHSKHSKTHKVQSVLFNKKHWTIPRAKKWLKENGYKFDDIDKKPNTLRFRQLDPDQFKRELWGYTTYRLPDNIELIIAYKRSKKKNSDKDINMIGGELVHVDINSHNSSGKSKNTMEGDGLKKKPKKMKPVSLTDKFVKIPKNMRGGMLGGVLDLEPLPRGPNKDLTFKPTQKILKTRNLLLNNLTSSDIKDLKKLFSEAGEEDIKKKEDIAKIRKATIQRIKTDFNKATSKAPKSRVRGTTLGKRQAIDKAKKKAKKISKK